MARRPWTTLKHQALEKLEPNLWTVAGHSTAGALLRRMTLVRLADARLVIWSAMPLEEGAMAEIEAWGTPAFILVPNGFHRLDAHAYKVRYPSARVLCPAKWRTRVAEAADLDGTFEELPKDQASFGWSEVRGTAGREAALEVTSDGRLSLILNDVLFNHPHRRGFGGAVLRLIGSSGGPRLTRIGRAFLMKDKAALRAQFEAWAALPNLARVIVSHVDTIDQNVANVLRRVALSI